MLYTCQDCKYIFAEEHPERCQDCGSKHIRVATADEQKEYQAYREEFETKA